jgi:pantoate kinase
MDREPSGKPISDPLKIGARGGGFVIGRGVKTEVRVERKRKDQIITSLNGQVREDAKVTQTVVQALLQSANVHARVTVRHIIDPPIGCGCGTSGAGALSTALALCRALDLDMTYNQIGQVAHVAEIACKTGLGTVAPLMVGGNVITVQPGAPGLCVVDRIPLEPDYRIVLGWFGPITKSAVLSDQNLQVRINRYGRSALEHILKEPTPENFMITCRTFAENAGFMTERLKRLLSVMEKNGAIGATQNMLGEAGHALVEERKVKSVYRAARSILPKKQILTSTVESGVARLI